MKMYILEIHKSRNAFQTKNFRFITSWAKTFFVSRRRNDVLENCIGGMHILRIFFQILKIDMLI